MTTERLGAGTRPPASAEVAVLLQLAERVERAQEGSRELDREIAMTCGFEVRRYDAPETSILVGALEFMRHADGSFAAIPHWTFSIDAALTLVPARWTRDVDATAPESGIRVTLAKGITSVFGDCLSEACATVAAALRARAVDAESHAGSRASKEAAPNT